MGSALGASPTLLFAALIISYARAFGLTAPLHSCYYITLVTLMPRRGQKGGSGGEGSFAAGSPPGFTARMDLWLKPPWRGLMPHEFWGSVSCLQNE